MIILGFNCILESDLTSRPVWITASLVYGTITAVQTVFSYLIKISPFQFPPLCSAFETCGFCIYVWCCIYIERDKTQYEKDLSSVCRMGRRRRRRRQRYYYFGTSADNVTSTIRFKHTTQYPPIHVPILQQKTEANYLRDVGN